jgi:anti-sigma regulatory factor (Ser/Thr protein kinase)
MHGYGRATRFATTTTTALSLEENACCVEVHSPAEMRLVFAWLGDWMRALGYPGKDIFALTLALREAVANAIRHGNGGDPDKCVWVGYLVKPDEALAEVQDQGSGFDPALVRARFAGQDGDRPVGRGLFLMQSYLSRVGFTPEGNRVTLCRRHSGSRSRSQGR